MVEFDTGDLLIVKGLQIALDVMVFLLVNLLILEVLLLQVHDFLSQTVIL